MNDIHRITFKNFKFFFNEVVIPVEGKNILLYGENGSGKSSIYWGLYTFLQSVFKDEAQIRKYFEPKNDSNLINRYSANTDTSSIEIEFKDGIQRIISNTVIKTTTDEDDKLVLETTLGSDFIDYKVLSRIYNVYHGQQIEIFEFIEHHFFPFINFTTPLIKPGDDKGISNATYWWDYIKNGLTKIQNDNNEIKTKFNKDFNQFNEDLGFYLESIIEGTNKYLQNVFKEKYKIEFNYIKAEYIFENSIEIYKVTPPKIFLVVELISDKITDSSKKKILNPQSFLNEAKLATLALAMRLAVLDEKFVAAYPKILVLDDLLMSMDMSNREFILNLILEKFLPDYQILFFTHQRNLFEDARNQIECLYSERAKKAGKTNTDEIKTEWKSEWKFMEMYEGENYQNIPIPIIQEYESSLQKALFYFKERIDYNACGNNLRSALEEFFLSFIPHNFLDGQTMLAGLIATAKTYFSYVGFDTQPLDKLDRYRERSLNPSSHYNPKSDYFKKELLEIFTILESLKKNKNEALIKKDEKLKFEIRTQNGKTFKYTAILLDHIRLYQKFDSSPSFFKDTDERGYVMIDFVEDNNNAISLNHKINQCTLQTLYNDTIIYINRSNVSVVETNMYTVFKDENETALEILKKY